MKILAGSFQCEANTFCSGRAGIGDFEVVRQDAVLEKLAAVPVFREAGAAVVPLIFASALPSGMVTKEAFEYYKIEFLDIVALHRDADGIYLYLHGSMYVEGMGSGEEGLVKAIRQIAGDAVPISVALDFHGNLSGGFLESVNAVQGFRTAPHTDHDDTERRAAQSLLACIRQKALPRPQYVRLPFLGGDASITAREPFISVTGRLKELDQREDIISAAFFNGQPWYDSPYTGNCAVVSGLDGQAGEEALKLAKLFWDGRENLILDGAMMPKEAVGESVKNRDGILFVTDSGDNTTAGANGEGTLLINLYLDQNSYLEQNEVRVLVCGILDAAVTNRLLELEPGDVEEIVLCAGVPMQEEHVDNTCQGENEVKTCQEQNKQELETKLSVTVKSKGAVFGWAGDEVGEGVRVSCGNVDLVLTNARAAFTTPEHFSRMGIDPEEYRVVVLKMGYLFPKLREMSQKTIFALTPGTSTNDFSSLDYKRLVRRMYPICEDITWEEILREMDKEAIK